MWLLQLLNTLKVLCMAWYIFLATLIFSLTLLLQFFQYSLSKPNIDFQATWFLGGPWRVQGVGFTMRFSHEIKNKVFFFLSPLFSAKCFCVADVTIIRAVCRLFGQQVSCRASHKVACQFHSQPSASCQSRLGGQTSPGIDHFCSTTILALKFHNLLLFIMFWTFLTLYFFSSSFLFGFCPFSWHFSSFSFSLVLCSSFFLGWWVLGLFSSSFSSWV